MLNIAEFQKRLSIYFPDASQVSDTAIRFVRKSSGRPYAVCYVDLSNSLPSTSNLLTEYQDELIGKYYFEGPKSLQWSNYLYFVTSKNKFDTKEGQSIKKMIENDRAFARKFVISEDEVQVIIEIDAPIHKSNTEQTDILNVWTTLLDRAQLSSAVIPEQSLPKRLEQIESGSTSNTFAGKRSLVANVDDARPSFIKNLNLKNYRSFPKIRNFEFGAVNLITGPNATGKTSLLEAIELFYCGRNNRNAQIDQQYEIEVRFQNGMTEIANKQRPLNFFRSRNLYWYGRPELKTNNLYQSFSQFNFLDTDAAVNISESSENVQEDLSKLLVGAEASKVWDNMLRLSETLSARRRELQQRLNDHNQEAHYLERQISSGSELTRPSDTLAAQLDISLEKLSWSRTDLQNDEVSLASLGANMAELSAIIEQVLSIDWMPPSPSRDDLAVYCQINSEIVQVANPILDVTTHLDIELIKLAKEASRLSKALDLANEIRRMVSSGVVERENRLSNLSHEIAMLNGTLAGTEPLSVKEIDHDIATIDQRLSRVRSIRTESENQLAALEAEYARFSALRHESLNLAQQLRQIAGRILKTSTVADTCPLCHTAFLPGELLIHMQHGLEGDLEDTSQHLLTQIAAIQLKIENFKITESEFTIAQDFCRRRGLKSDTTLAEIGSEILKAKDELQTAQVLLSLIQSEISALNNSGISTQALSLSISRLAELQLNCSDLSDESVNNLISKIIKDQLEISTRTDEVSTRLSFEYMRIRQLFPRELGEQTNWGSVVSALRERVQKTVTLLDSLGILSQRFPWPSALPLSDLLVSVKTIWAHATNYTTVLENEQRQRQIVEVSQKRKDQIASQIDALNTRLSRISSAYKEIQILIRDNSLADAMQFAIAQNRREIESIFGRLHTPSEFSGIGSDFGTLVRKSGGLAKLSQVSTGQRAAFALSIFLAQNARLKTAPPLMLIDDPIAHIDDLNALSFLDYLRSVVLNGDRQVFFATANDKIATLFERKFDFLGEDKFKKISLRRISDLN